MPDSALVNQVFPNPPISLGNGNFLHVIEIDSISPELAILIDERIGMITEGATDTPKALMKKRLYDFLQEKKGSNIEMGAVAEFMIHLYMNIAGFKQECVYYNLEERSMKKGFDGYYSKDKEEWILESKSGGKSVTGNSHSSKFTEAYSDLKKKVKDEYGNNPWRNAWTHACNIYVETAEDIRKNLKQLADDFDSGKYTKLENLNIAPASTIFLEGNWENIDKDDIKLKIVNALSTRKFKGINVLCINNKSLELLEEYLIL